MDSLTFFRILKPGLFGGSLIRDVWFAISLVVWGYIRHKLSTAYEGVVMMKNRGLTVSSIV